MNPPITKAILLACTCVTLGAALPAPELLARAFPTAP